MRALQHVLRNANVGREIAYHTMTVPKMSQLQRGVNVNIVLKADQRSGKLTTGQVSETLTRGDHPRGIKVRLSNGQVGRVQSLAASTSITSTGQASCSTAEAHGKENAIFGGSPLQPGRSRQREARERDILQRHDGEVVAPLESLSLADYVKGPKSSKSAPVLQSCAQDTAQIQLEREFPKLDTALIAAILADHSDLELARGTLSSLSDT